MYCLTDAVNNKMKMFKNCLAAGKIAASEMDVMQAAQQ